MRRGRINPSNPSRAALPSRKVGRGRCPKVAWRCRSVGRIGAVSSASIRLQGQSRSWVSHHQRSGPSTSIGVNAICRANRTNARDARSRQGLGMPSLWPASASTSRCPRSVSSLPYTIRSHLTLEPRTGSCQRIHGNILVDMNSLRMLPQVVQAREAPRAMTLKGPFTCMFPDVPCQVLTPGEAQVTRRVVGAVKALRLLLLARSCSLGTNTFLVRSLALFDCASLSIGIVHIHIDRIRRLVGVSRVVTPRHPRFRCCVGYLHALRERAGGERLLTSHGNIERRSGRSRNIVDRS